VRVGLNGGIRRRAGRASDAMPWRHPEGAKRTKGMPLEGAVASATGVEMVRARLALPKGPQDEKSRGFASTFS